ncbi:MAG: SdrD B-like domain-containing protein, partial [Bacteroidota bacterium]
QGADPLSTAILNPCDLSINTNAAAGCYSFIRSSDGTGSTNRCGAFIQTLNVEIVEVPDILSVSADQSLDCGDAVMPLTISTTGSVIHWESNTTSCGAQDWEVIPNSASNSYTPPFPSSTTYYRAVLEGIAVNCQTGNCELVSECIIVSVPDSCTSSCAEKLLDWDVEDWPAGDQMATFPIGLTEVTLDFQAATGFATYPIQEDILDEEGDVVQTVTIDVPLPDDTEVFNNGAGIGGNGESIELRMGQSNTTLSISMEFASPVDQLTFSLLDFDEDDAVNISAMNGMTNVVPTLGAETGSPSFVINSNQATGDGSNVNNSPDASLNVMFADSVDAVTLTFTNTTELALSDLKICEETVMSLGNLVWSDIDNDGLRDNTGEPGLENVELKLYKDENLDGTPDDFDPVDSTTTDANGHYLFDDLQRGNYLVWVDSTNFELGAVLDSFSTSLFTEIDPNDDADNKDNGLNTFRKQAGAKGIFSGTVTLVPNTEPLTEPDQGLAGSGNAPDENSNLTVDFGVLKDSDFDGAENEKEGYTDRDNDGIPNAFDFDPAGYIYCVETGEIVTGGTIEVISTPPGGAVMFERDGTSGSYQFFINDVPGVYEIMYTPPAGYTLTTNPDYAVSTGNGTGGAFDPTPGSPDNLGMDDPVILGTGAIDGSTTGSLPDASAAANPYYLTFELDPSPANPDPFVFNNNIPLDCPPPVEACECAPTAYSTCWDATMYEEPPSSDPADYPFTSTITDYAGSGVDLTVEIKQPQRGDAASHVSPGQRCGCTFDDELGPYFTCGEVFRNWKSTGATAGVPDTIIFSFSEPVLIDRLGFGGFRTRSATDPAVAEFTFFSGPNASGQKVVSNLADPGSTAMIDTGDPLDPNAAINILQDQGGQTTSLYNGTYYYISNQRNNRGWTILNMDTVLIQSILWTQYNTTSSDPMDALDNIIAGSPNNSGYMSNLDIFRCESCPTPVSLGSTVFADLNNNGVQDATEMGIADVTVQLFAADGTEIEVGPDGVLGTVDDAPGGMMTNANGDYFFDGLDTGEYVVQIPASEFAMGTGTLEDLPISSNTSSGTFTGETDPDDNVDNDDEGLQAGGLGTVVVSDTVTLTTDSEPTDMDTETAQGNMQDSLNDASGNMTLDFGFFASVMVGDTAFVDLDMDGLQSAADPG